MVADRWERYREGEDALMVAKRNAEARELNAMARERMRVEGKLGAEEIRVGEARFAAGDQVITRINDQKLGVFNRELWRIAEVHPDSGRLVLDGIDTCRQVCVDSVFLGRVNLRDGAPAIEHGYAATIYQAQGAPLDSAFVMADPSMTREEFYVATSRTRGETFIYATPEVQLAREEIAPDSPYLRYGLEHIGEAAERIGAQKAAHDEALRSQFAQMPTDQLARCVRELRSAARAERQQLPEVGHEARAKMAVAEHVLAERERAAATAARHSPPDYIKSELGERPKDPAKAAAWDKGVREIEGYRTRNGVVGRHTALGGKPKDHAAQAEQRRMRERLQRTQRQLGLKRQRSAERSMRLGIGR